MRPCCPPSRGCNAPGTGQPCALELCRRHPDDPDAARAVSRWEALQDALQHGRGDKEIRFRRRAFVRARDTALVTLALLPPPPARERPRPARRRRRRPGTPVNGPAGADVARAKRG